MPASFFKKEGGNSMFIEELQNGCYKKNSKGGLYYGTTFDANLDCFAMASRFMDQSKLTSLFNKAYNENKEVLAANILYFLDIRNGKGERHIFKTFFYLMCYKDTLLAKKILYQIPELGRYDYIFTAFDTPIQKEAFFLVKRQLEEDIKSENPSLLAKWMPSLRTHNKTNSFAQQLAKMLGYSEREYRKILSSLRSKIDIVEKRITNSDFTFIYESVPAKAMKKYNSLFMNKDYERFSEYLNLVSQGKASIKTTAVNPYEIIRALDFGQGNPKLLNQMWNNLQNYFDGNHSNVLVMADTSGSMRAFNSIPMHASLGLAMYAATKNKGLFHNVFLNFSSEPSFQELSGNTLEEMMDSIDYYNFDMSTNIDAAIELILNASKKSKEDCPSHLVIISDMEFDSCTSNKTNFQHWKELYQENGLEMPKIIFWNVALDTRGIPITKNEQDVALVSGFSPTVFKGLFDLENYNPTSLMLEILKPYLEILKKPFTSFKAA